MFVFKINLSLFQKRHNLQETYFINEIYTPGIREINPIEIKKYPGHYFLDFLKYMNKCRFSTCTHHHELGNSIIKPV